MVDREGEERGGEVGDVAPRLAFTLGPKLRLGPHIPEATRRPRASPRSPQPTAPQEPPVEDTRSRTRWQSSDVRVAWYATKQSFGDIPSQAELGTE